MTTVQFDTAFKKITRILKEKGVYTIAISYLRYAHKNYKNLRKEFLKGKKMGEEPSHLFRMLRIIEKPYFDLGLSYWTDNIYSINRIIEAHEYEINNDTDDE